MHYGETKKVRAVQGGTFVEDFKRAGTILVYTSVSQVSVPALKTDIWERAKDQKIHYKMTDEIYANRRLVMLIA